MNKQSGRARATNPATEAQSYQTAPTVSQTGGLTHVVFDEDGEAHFPFHRTSVHPRKALAGGFGVGASQEGPDSAIERATKGGSPTTKNPR